MKIILVRHGECERNAGTTENKDSPLTKKGKMQAEKIGKKLKKEKIKIDEIYTSNMIRSKQTGEIISKITKVPIKGSFEVLNEFRTRDLNNGLKMLIHFRARKLKKLLEKITENRKEDITIMIVAHGHTNRIIIGSLLKIPLRKYILRFMQKNTALTLLSWKEEFKNWNLESLNDFSHLSEELK